MSDETHTPLWLNAFVALVVAFLLAPLLVVIMVSFNNEAILRFPPRGFTLHWFVEALTYPTFVRALIFSTLLAALATFLSACIGVPAALAISRGGKSTAAIEAFVLAPLSFPLIVLGVTLLFYFGAIGLGLSPIGLLAAHVVITVPYIVRSVLAVHRAVDPHLEEAAALLGATPFRRFRRVTLPLIRPGLVSGSVLAFLVSFDNVPVSIFLTRDDTVTLPVAVLSYLVYSYDPSVAALYTAKLVLVLAAMLIIERNVGLSSVSRLSSGL
jgi:putative spermidine/putrescine transport system permease protein